jgi:hypothetical protein
MTMPDPDDFIQVPRIAELEASLAAEREAHAATRAELAEARAARVDVDGQLLGRNEELCRELAQLQEACPPDVLLRVYGDLLPLPPDYDADDDHEHHHDADDVRGGDDPRDVGQRDDGRNDLDHPRDRQPLELDSCDGDRER